MKFSEITEQMRKEITETIKTKLLKLGIDTEVEISAKTIYTGEEMISAKTKPFNTTPVVYKSVSIDGNGFIKPIREDVYEVTFCLNYRFLYFSGGENGVDLGAVTFRFFPGTERVACLGLVL